MLEEQQEHAQDLLQATADKELAAAAARDDVCRVEVHWRAKMDAKDAEARAATERWRDQLSEQKADAAETEAQLNQEHADRIQRQRQRLEGALQREREEARAAAEQAKRLATVVGGCSDHLAC